MEPFLNLWINICIQQALQACSGSFCLNEATICKFALKTWTFTSWPLGMLILSAAAINHLYSSQTARGSGRSLVGQTVARGSGRFLCCYGPLHRVGRSVSDCLRFGFRGVLEEAVCLHTSFYLHRLWPSIKFWVLPWGFVDGNWSLLNLHKHSGMC